MEQTIGIIGLGFVGFAIYRSFVIKNREMNTNYKILAYDKFNDRGNATFADCLNASVIFLALPTPFNHSLNSYDYSAIYDTCRLLKENNYNGTIVIKSTMEPTITKQLYNIYDLNLIHNPEFLTAKTAFEDFHNQKHIVLGKHDNCKLEGYELVKIIYHDLYPDAEISECTSDESECMKIFCNTFYSVKIQYFNELYLISQNIGANYDKIKELMLKNGWINPMHTQVPGNDGKMSYGGLCFPKDTNALLQFMKKNNIPHKVLEATINERNEMRDDHDNIKF